MGPKKKATTKKKKNGGDKAVKKSKSKRNVGSRKEGGKAKSRVQVDVLSDVAMDNAYYSCHNVQDLLRRRGFPWAEAQKKKKKGKKGK